MPRLVILFVLLALPASAQVRVVTNINHLLSLQPSTTQPWTDVMGFALPMDWGGPKRFTWDPTNNLATNAIIIRAPGRDEGRYVHKWDGDVMAFGVTADWNGTTGTDNSPFLQAAVSSVGTSRHPFLHFPAGNMYFGSTVYATNENVSFVGNGRNASRIYNGAAGPFLVIGSQGVSTFVRQTYTDFSIEGVGPSAMTAAIGIEGRGISRAVFRNLRLLGLARGLQFNVGSYICDIENPHILNCDIGVLFIHGTAGVEQSGNAFHFRGGEIQANRIGIQLGHQTNAVPATTQALGFDVSGVTIEANTECGVWIINCQKPIIHDSYFELNGMHIRLGYPTPADGYNWVLGASIDNNWFYSHPNGAVVLSGSTAASITRNFFIGGTTNIDIKLESDRVFYTEIGGNFHSQLARTNWVNWGSNTINGLTWKTAGQSSPSAGELYQGYEVWRDGAPYYKLDEPLFAGGAKITNSTLKVVNGFIQTFDTTTAGFSLFEIQKDGFMSWGNGNVAKDVHLRRIGPGVLSTTNLFAPVNALGTNLTLATATSGDLHYRLAVKANGNMELGSGGAQRDAAVIWDQASVVGLINPITSGGAGLALMEMVAPSTTVANTARLYLSDNGAGKSVLVIKWGDGSTNVIATQP